jgi:hypothetical protein
MTILVTLMHVLVLVSATSRKHVRAHLRGPERRKTDTSFMNIKTCVVTIKLNQ